MERPLERDLFRLYWRSFFPGWLIPIPVAALILLAHFLSEDIAVRIFPYAVVAVIIYILATEFRPLGLWRRGEITYWEMYKLSMPIMPVALLYILVCSLIFNYVHH